jgi:hypothetical protein
MIYSLAGKCPLPCPKGHHHERSINVAVTENPHHNGSIDTNFDPPQFPLDFNNCFFVTLCAGPYLSNVEDRYRLFMEKELRRLEDRMTRTLSEAVDQKLERALDQRLERILDQKLERILEHNLERILDLLIQPLLQQLHSKEEVSKFP